LNTQYGPTESLGVSRSSNISSTAAAVIAILAVLLGLVLLLSLIGWMVWRRNYIHKNMSAAVATVSASAVYLAPIHDVEGTHLNKHVRVHTAPVAKGTETGFDGV
jgi:uncharacterized membrane protein